MAENMQLAADLETLEAEPGQEIETSISIQNLGVAVGVFSIAIDGLDPTWYRLSTNNVSLFPGDQTTVTLTVAPPRLGTSLAGTYDFQCKVTSQKEDEEEQSIHLSLVVRPFFEFLIDYSPQRARGARAAHTLSITNSGNSELGFELSGRDTDGLCQFSFEPEAPVVAPSATLEVPVVVRGKRPLRGAPVQYQYEVTATPVDGVAEASSRPGFLEVPARIPAWIFRAATLAAVVIVLGIAIWYFVFFEPKAPVAVLNVSPSRVALTEGESSNLAVTMLDSDGNELVGRLVSWSSSDPAVASVSKDSGFVQALEPGSVVITATLQGEEFEPQSATIIILPTVVSTDCLRYDPETLRFGVSRDAKLVVTDGEVEVITLRPEDSQVDAMNLAVRHNGRCFIGRSATTGEVLSSEVEFWIGSSGIESDELRSTECLPYSPSNVQLRNTASGNWVITDGASLLLELDDQADAQAALILAGRHSSRCYIDLSVNEANQVTYYLAQYWE